MATIVDDVTHKRDKSRIRALPDEELVFVMLGLNAEMEGAPNWGRTEKAGYMRRLVFMEIATRWIPADVFGAAWSTLTSEEGGDDD